jgi:hypothetical protein
VTTRQINATEKKYLVMSDVSSMAQNLPAMYGLQRPTKGNTPTSPSGSSHTNQTLNKFICFHKYRTIATHKPTSSANQQYTGLKKM